MSSEDGDNIIEEEVCALEATLMEDVRVLRADDGSIEGVEVSVVPATAQNVSQQHVKCVLVAYFPPNYPSEQPSVSIRNPRGIDESVLSKIEREIVVCCQQGLGVPIIYELVEMVRENLTENNTPSCICAICLYHFVASDLFTKTECFHYFHKHCLGRYMKSCETAREVALAEQQQQLPWQQSTDSALTLCPVCREPIYPQESSCSLLDCPPPALEASEPLWRADAAEVQALRKRMRKLFCRQQQRGGIIDLEHEKNKFLISQDSHIEESAAVLSLDNGLLTSEEEDGNFEAASGLCDALNEVKIDNTETSDVRSITGDSREYASNKREHTNVLTLFNDSSNHGRRERGHRSGYRCSYAGRVGRCRRGWGEYRARGRSGGRGHWAGQERYNGRDDYEGRFDFHDERGLNQQYQAVRHFHDQGAQRPTGRHQRPSHTRKPQGRYTGNTRARGLANYASSTRTDQS